MLQGISLAWETIAIAIMVIIVIIVLSLIFRDQIMRLFEVDGRCGEGSYREYACSDEPLDDALHCFRSEQLCSEGYCCRVN